MIVAPEWPLVTFEDFLVVPQHVGPGGPASSLSPRLLCASRLTSRYLSYWLVSQARMCGVNQVLPPG